MKEDKKKEKEQEEKVEPIVEEYKPEEEKVDKSAEYLEMAQRLQADFENFRRRAGEQIIKAKEDGKISIIEVFLPCLDMFSSAKKSIKDDSTLQGVEMIENKILETLKSLGVKKNRINWFGLRSEFSRSYHSDA